MKNSSGNLASFPVSGQGMILPPSHLKATNGSHPVKKDGFYFLRHQTIASILLFFQEVLIFCPSGEVCAHRAVFFAMRQEAKERPLPRDLQSAFHRRKRLPVLEEATGILDLEPNSQIF